MAEKNILIIKEKALGDVLRTTPILRVLKGKIFWLSSKEAEEFLPEKTKFLYKVIIREEVEKIQNINFDLIINLEEDVNLAKLVNTIKYKKLIGVYFKKKLFYTAESKEWFDQSLISRYGKRKADLLKFKNKKTYQEMIFRMIGEEFNGEEYIIKGNLIKNIKEVKKVKPVFAIEKRAGQVWPMKKWPYYHLIAKYLERKNYKFYYLTQKKSIKEFFEEINNCDFLITGDTFAMHIALALKKNILALFICTSPWEIFDYRRMIKIVNPYLKEAFYRKDYDKKLVRGIKPSTVIEAINNYLNKSK